MIFLDGQADSSDHKIIIEERIVEKERRLQVEARGDIEIKQTRETEMQQRDREDTRTTGEAVGSLMREVPNIAGHQEEKSLSLLVRL